MPETENSPPTKVTAFQGEDFKLPNKINGINLTQRDQQILLALQTEPRNLNDLADYFEVSYHTVRKYVKKLEQLGLVKPSVWRDENGAEVWRTVFTDMMDSIGQLVFKDWEGKTQPLGNITAKFIEGLHVKFGDMGRILIALWLQGKQAEAGLDKGYWNGPTRGEMKKMWMDKIKTLETMTRLMQEISVAPVWNGDAHKYFELKISEELAQEAADSLVLDD